MISCNDVNPRIMNFWLLGEQSFCPVSDCSVVAVLALTQRGLLREGNIDDSGI